MDLPQLNDWVTVVNHWSTNFNKIGVVTDIEQRSLGSKIDFKVRMLNGPNKGHSYWFKGNSIQPRNKPSADSPDMKNKNNQPYILIEEDGEHHLFDSKKELEEFMDDLVDDDGSTHRLNHVNIYKLASTSVVGFNVKIGVED